MSNPPNIPAKKSAIESLEHIKAQLAAFPEWVSETLRYLRITKVMTDVVAAAHLKTRGIDQNRPLHFINDQTRWLDRDKFGSYTISPSVEKELREILADD